MIVIIWTMHSQLNKEVEHFHSTAPGNLLSFVRMNEVNENERFPGKVQACFLLSEILFNLSMKAARLDTLLH